MHLEMLQLGIKIKSGQEIMRQISCLIFENVKSFIEKIQIGNLGGENVPHWKPFLIEKELVNTFPNTEINLARKRKKRWVTSDMRSDLLSLHPLHITDTLDSIKKQNERENKIY